MKSILLVSDSGIVGKSRKRNLTPFSETDRYSPGKEYYIIQVNFGNDYRNIEYSNSEYNNSKYNNSKYNNSKYGNSEYGNSEYGKNECDRTDISIGVSICYDTNYDTVEKLKSNGAHLILAPFNDSGFGSIFHNIHRYYPVIKAIQCNIPIAVSNYDGISQIIGSDGNIIKELGFSDTGIITHTYCINNNADCNKSLYLLFGQYMELGVFIFAILAFFMCIFKHINDI